MKSRGRLRRLGVESLERRALLAGNVAASVQGNVLVIEGDNAGNYIEIRQLPPASSTGEWPGARYQIMNPTGSTLINGASSVVMEGVKDGVQVDMKGGNDTIFVYRPNAPGQIAALPGTVSINMGAGNDGLSLWFVNHQQTTVNLGTGSDSTGIRGQVNALTVLGDPQFDPTDPGADERVNLELTAAGPVSIDAKYGNNHIEAKLITTTSRAAVSITTGKGADIVNLHTKTSILSALVRIDTGDGNDSVALRHIDSAANVVVNVGRGNDDVVFADISVDARLSVWLGEGDDLLASAGTNHCGSVVFRGWDGTDTLDLDGTDTFDSEDVSGFEVVL